MKKSLQRLLILIATGLGINLNAYAILPGTYTIGGTSPNYTTLSDAINALNATGVQGGNVIFNIRSGTYTSTSWRGEITTVQNASASARVIFQSESGNPADVVINVPGTSSDNYIVKFNKANHVTFKNLTFVNTNTSYGRIFDFASTSSEDSIVNCSLTGATSTTSSTTGELAIVYSNQYTGSNVVFYKNVFNNGAMWVRWYGTGSSSWATGGKFIENTFNMTNSGYYGTYMYYHSDTKFLKNTFNYTGTGVFYGLYTYYGENGMDFAENTFNMNSTSTLYPFYLYYTNYYASTSGFNGNGPTIRKNIINTTNTSGTTVGMYTYYCHYMTVTDNIFNCNSTTGAIQLQGPLYYCRESRAEGNTFNFTASSSGGISNTSGCLYTGGNTWPDTVQKNIFNLKTAGGTIDWYTVYYGGNTGSTMNNNELNFTNTTGSSYCRIQYAMGAEFTKNKIKMNSTSGLMYGMYLYGTTSYAGAKVHNNDIELTSTGNATHYALYGSYMNTDKVFNNIYTSSTLGASNLVYFPGTQYNGNRIYNNVFHSLQSSLTSTTNYGVYADGTSGEIFFNNNIVSRATPLTSGGYGVYNTGSTLKSDYNLYDLPGATVFYQSPTKNGASLQTFREASKVDYNSLVYKAPYVNAAARDFTINASSPDAWAVNGRGVHDSTRYTDRSGAAVPLFVTSGVPDIGAYEVDPTSIPPDAVATPANPVANAFQLFTFGQDTVLAIEWGATVPATYTVKQYTGIKATPVPAGLKRMFFNIQGDASSLNHSYTAYTFYKDPWIGDIPTENDAVLARQSGTGGWVGYNYSNAVRETTRNIVSTVGTIDSAGSFTVVENGRIGIRCVYPPTGIRISNITAESADIKWDAIYNPLGYQVIVKKTSTPPTDTEWGAALNPTSNSVTSGNLNEDTKYYVFVRNICGEKDTSGYTIDSFTTIITCHAPTITVVDVHNTRAVVYWDSVRTAYGYEVALTTSSTAPANGTNITSTERLFSFLDAGKTYYAHVRANCNTIYTKSEWTTVEFSTWSTGVEQINNAGAGIEIYPNPVREELVVTLGGKVISGTVTVQDMTGKTLKAVQATENKVHVNVNELPAGVYILQYAEDGRREQVKFTKQ